MIGTTISHYRVLQELGRGGMGIVYEAEDILLGRRAALKFLPGQVAHDAPSLARFQREARAASALNHPNICTIYEIGEQDGRWFIAMELLEGITLEQAMGGRPVAVDKLLDWGIQLGDALDAAHRQGIVHRDLKPANIFLTKRGALKVLDFGLAKATEPLHDPAAVTSAPTATMPSPLTSPGLAVGTIAFMSPEQARGEEVDSRSDLFSLGIILYLMGTARLPFWGKSSALVFDAILHRDPAPPSEFNPAIPPDLERVINKCLEKDPDIRCQHASELRADLKRLKRDSSAHLSRERSASGQSNEMASSGSGFAPAPAPSVTGPEIRANGGAFSSSALAAAAGKHRIGVAVGAAMVCVIIAAAAFGIYQFVHRPSRIPFQNTAMTSITSSGDNWSASMSPDGKYVATIRRDSKGADSLWMRHLSTNSNAQIVPASDVVIEDVTFAPDGDYVYFRSNKVGSQVRDLYRAPVLGGPAALIIHDIDTPPTFNAAQGRLGFIRNSPALNRQVLATAGLDGSDEKVVLSTDGFNFREPAWSPDGRRFAVTEEMSGALTGVAMIDAQTGKTAHFTVLPEPNFLPNDFSWMPDGKGLIVVYRDLYSGKSQIGYITYPGTEFKPITNDLNRYDRASLSADGKVLSTVVFSQDTSLDIFPAEKKDITDSQAASLGSASWFDWIGNDQMVVGNESGGIKTVAISSGEQATLLSSGDLHAYDLYSCGPQSIIFTGVPVAAKAISHIYALDLKGGGQRQLTVGKADQYARCTPDGSTVVYFSFDDHAIYKMPLRGGAPEILIPASRRPQNQFGITPDGRELIVIVPVEGANGGLEFNFISLATGQVTKRLPSPGDSLSPTVSPDGTSITFNRRERGVDNLWQLPVAGGNPSRLTNFHLTRSTTQRIRTYGWSPDGKRLAMARSFVKGDVVVLHDNFQ